MKIPQSILDTSGWFSLPFFREFLWYLVIYNDNNTLKKGLFGVKFAGYSLSSNLRCSSYIPKIGCWDAAGRTESNDPMLETPAGEFCKWWWEPLWSMDVRLEHPEELPGDAKPSEPLNGSPLYISPSNISEGAGVQGGVSICGIGWSLKQADS